MTFQSFSTAVRFNATSIGLADFVVASALAGYETPVQGSAVDGKVYGYYAQTADGIIWEAGNVTWSLAANKMVRTTIKGTSAGDQNKISFPTVPIVDIFPSPSTSLEQGQFPSGTTMTFRNATAPPGWTRVTTFDDAAIRIIGTGAPSSGGSNGFSTVFAQTVVGNFTLSGATTPFHQHSDTEPSPDSGPWTPNACAVSPNAGGQRFGNATGGFGSGGAHNHTITMQIKYADFIIASKN